MIQVELCHLFNKIKNISATTLYDWISLFIFPIFFDCFTMKGYCRVKKYVKRLKSNSLATYFSFFFSL